MSATITETIDLSGRGGNALSYSDFGAGIDLTVTAYKQESGMIRHRWNVGRWGTGLGAQNPRSRWENHQVDGAGPDEILLFEFGQAVSITNITFSYFSTRDDFDLGTYSASNGGYVLDSYLSDLIINPLSSTDGVYDDEPGDIGTSALEPEAIALSSIFGIGADHSSDSFKVNSITIAYDDGIIPSVPLPAGGLLLLTGLLGLAWRGRRAS